MWFVCRGLQDIHPKTFCPPGGGVGITVIEPQFGPCASWPCLWQVAEVRVGRVCRVRVQLKNRIAITQNGEIRANPMRGDAKHGLQHRAMAGHVLHQQVQPQPAKAFAKVSGGNGFVIHVSTYDSFHSLYPVPVAVNLGRKTKEAVMQDAAGNLDIVMPDVPGPENYADPVQAVDRLCLLYDAAATFLRDRFLKAMTEGHPGVRIRAYYPEIRLVTTRFDKIDSRLSFGHVTLPGTYATTVTRPHLFRHYLTQQIGLLLHNHGVKLCIGLSDTPMPVHFAVANFSGVTVPQDGAADFALRDVFDVPELSTTNDDIVNGDAEPAPDGALPLAPFTAQRVDYSLARLSHYTATDPEHFQNHVLFTNYQFYVSEFEAYARAALADPDSGYTSFVSTGNVEITDPDTAIDTPERMPQMPTYHLKRGSQGGITLVNIGVGPSNAKTATDHIAVLRPHAWLMVGHCAGLRNSQSLGDYVLAHAYLREDKVLDDDLPVWVPIPALAEIQIALERAVAAETQLDGFDLKRVMRTGTVATLDNRNWELRENGGPVKRLSQSRAIALDMESATIAANGFRFRVPYGTLLCVSDKPLHGELKLPGMATDFYKTQVIRHLRIGIRAMEQLREMPLERIHSRKLRSFEETAFL
jgi:AMP nucleosidase